MKYIFWVIGIIVFIFIYEKIRRRIPLAIKSSFFTLRYWVTSKTAKVISIWMRNLWRLRENIISGARDPEHLTGLTAIDDADENGVYERSLLSGLNTPAVTNIGLCGPYGSGKSSILRTFMRRHPELKFLTVSLAAISPDQDIPQKAEDSVFREPSGSDGIIKNWTGKLSEQIEYSILQQMFYHVREQQIPFSRFKRVRGRSRFNLLALTVSMFIFLLAVCYLFFHSDLSLLPDSWNAWITANDDTLKKLSWFFIVAASLAVIFNVIQLYRNAQLIKINLNSAQLEIAPKRDSSALNKHLDEILYFFSEVHIDIVVIEDLDRFANPEIFVKLREINILINNAKEVGRKVTFIYALRDDVFANEDRTKFFDMLVPVIPVTNASNAAGRLNTEIGAIRLIEPIPSMFLNDLALFVQDTRLLINIVNEFRVYQAQLVGFETNSTNLLAIIVYKNKFPSDFAALQYNKGLLYSHFSKKQKYIESILKPQYEEKLKIDTKLSDIRSTFLENIGELRMVYLAQLYNEIHAEAGSGGFRGRIYVDYKEKGLKEMTEDKNFDYLRGGRTIEYSNGYSSRTEYSKRFAHIEQLVGGSSYQERYNRVSELFNYQVKTLEVRLEEINKNIQEARNYSIQEIMALPEMKSVATPIDQYPLLAYLVRNGYINENYSYYLSQFTEGEITKGDFDFLWAVKSGKKLAWSHKLEKLPALVRRFDEKEFSSPHMLNTNMAYYLVSDGNIGNNMKLSRFMGLLRPIDEQRMNFIDQVVSENENGGAMVAAACEYIPGFWDFVEMKSNYTTEKKNSYVRHIIEHAQVTHIELQNKEGHLKNFISRQVFFLNPRKNNIDIVELQKFCQKLQIRFSFTDVNFEVESEMLNFIYSNSMYTLTPLMLSNIIKRKLPDFNEEVFNQAQYSNIRISELAPLKEYISTNLPEYVSNVFLQIEGGTKESEGPMLNMINSEALSLDLKEQVIDRTVFIIENIHHCIDRNTWNSLMRNCRISATWDNVYKYVDQNKITNGTNLTDDLFTFLNDQGVTKKLTMNGIENVQMSVDIKPMVSEIILSGKLSINVLENYLDTYLPLFDQIDFANFSKEKAKVLLGKKKVVLNPSTFASLQKHHPDLIGDFVFTQWTEFLNVFDQLEVKIDAWVAIFAFKRFEINQQEILNPLVPEDLLPDLLEKGTVFSDKILKSQNITFDYDVLNRLVSNAAVNKGNVITLLINSIPILGETDIIKLLNGFGKEYTFLTNPKEGAKILNSEIRKDLLLQLQSADKLIEHFEIDGKYIVVKMRTS